MCILPTFSVFSFHNKSPKQDMTLWCSRFQCIALQKCFYCHAVPKALACLVIYYIIPLFPSRGNILVPIASSLFFYCILFYGGLPAKAVIRFWPYFPSLSFNVKKKKMLQQSHLDHSRSSVEWRLRWPSSTTWRSWAQSSGWSGCSGTLWRSGTLCKRVGARWGRSHLLLGKKEKLWALWQETTVPLFWARLSFPLSTLLVHTGGTGPWSVQHTDPEIQQVRGPAGQGPAQE